MRTKLVAALAAVVALSLVSCAAPAATPTPTATSTPTPPALTPGTPAVASPTPTATPAPTEPAVKRGGTLRTSWDATLEHFDLHQTGSLSSFAVATLGYNGLIANPADDPTANSIIGDLAESWEFSEDGKRVTFKLRRGVKFHDGTEMTSADAKFSLDRIFSPPEGTISARVALFDMVESVETPDEYTVVVNNKYPSAVFIPFLVEGWNIIVPRHVVERACRTWTPWTSWASRRTRRGSPRSSRAGWT